MNYYFPQKFISKFRIFLYSIGLFIVTFRKLLIGSSIILLCLIFKDFIYFYYLKNQVLTIDQANFIIIIPMTVSTYLYGFIFFIWKIKKLSNNEDIKRFEFLFLILKKFFQIQFIMLIFSLLYLLAKNYYFFPIIYFYPVFIITFPLYLLQKISVFRSLYLAFKLCIGNWLYISFSFGIFIMVCLTFNYVIHSFNLSAQNIIAIEQIVHCFILLPYFCAYSLMLLNSLQHDKLDNYIIFNYNNSEES